MNKTLVEKINETERVKKAREAFEHAPDAEKKQKQIEIGIACHVEAYKLLKTKGWSDSAIAEHLEISESGLQVIHNELDK